MFHFWYHSKKNFIGKKALIKQKEEGIYKMFVGFTCYSSDAILLGRETIFRNGEKVGWLSSGGYGYTIDKYIGYGYIRSSFPIDDNFIINGSYELEVAKQRYKCKVHLKPLYDPLMKKLKM